MRPAVTWMRRRASVIQPSARIAWPTVTGLRKSMLIRAVTPQLSWHQGPGHDLVEDRAQDPAVDDPLPALEAAGHLQLGPAAAGLQVELEVQADLVELAAGEAVVRPDPEVLVARGSRGSDRAASSARSGAVRHAASSRGSAPEPAVVAVAAKPDQTSRFWTFRASVLMKSLRGSTRSPISIVKMASASAASSTSARSSVRVSGFIVVSQSWSAFISPRPLKRWTVTFLTASFLTIASRSASDGGVVGHLAGADPEERRLGDEEVAVLDDLRHVPEEEGQQQGPDVGAVHVGVGHDDDAVVAELGQVERVADAGAQGDHERPDVLARDDLVQAGLLDVEELAAQRQDRLEAAVATLLGRAAGRVALDDVQLALGRVAFLAVGQLARQRHALEGALADDQVAGLAGRLAGPGGGERLLDDPPAVGRVLVQVLADPLGDGRLDLALDLGVAELGLGLALELRVDELDADDRRQAFAHVVAGEVGVGVLEDAGAAGVVVERAGQGGAEAGQVACRRRRC